MEEVFTIAREAQIRTQIWHLKTAYAPNFGRMPEILAKIEAARAQGLDVSANQYPYDRAANDLDACLPPWVREGGREKLLSRLKDKKAREKVKADMANASPTGRTSTWAPADPTASWWPQCWTPSWSATGARRSRRSPRRRRRTRATR